MQGILPFIVINILFVYKEEVGSGILNRLLLGADDGVMWYIPWKFTFYLVFYVLCRIFKGNMNYVIIGIVIVCVPQTLLFNYLGMGSQWYTSDGALVVGTVVALNEKKIKKNIWIDFAVAVGLVASILTSQIIALPIVQGCIITLSGMLFVILIFSLSTRIGNINLKWITLINYMGALSFWVHMVHMKVAVMLSKIGALNLIAMLLQKSWKCIGFVIGKGKK